MTDPKIYTALLHLQHPWYISRIDVDVKAEEAHVFITHHHGQLPCSSCGTMCNVRDHGDERVWRHLDLWQAKTFLHAAMPRTDCPKHGVLTVKVPWSEPLSRYSMAFEARVILALQSTKTVAVASQDSRDRRLGDVDAKLEHFPTMRLAPHASLPQPFSVAKRTISSSVALLVRFCPPGLFACSDWSIKSRNHLRMVRIAVPTAGDYRRCSSRSLKTAADATPATCSRISAAC